MVNLVTVKDRELMKVGKYDLSTGEFEATPELIQSAIKAHEAAVLRKPTIRLGHNDPRFSGDPAVGWIDNVRASEDGTTLYGDLVGVPQWLADTMPSAYPSVSIEGMYDYTAPDGSTHDFILTGLALLGATPPGIGDLKSVQDVQKLYEDPALIAAAIGEIGGTAVKFTVEAAQTPQIQTETEGEPAMALPDKIAEALGVDASADEDTILAKVAELTQPAPAPEPVEPKPELVAAAAAKMGLVTIEAAALDQLKGDAEAGRAAREQQITEADRNLVSAAIKDGRIPPARKEHWMGVLKSDREGYSQVLASLPKGLIPVVEAGHGIGAEDVPEIDADLDRVHNKVMARFGISTQKVN